MTLLIYAALHYVEYVRTYLQTVNRVLFLRP